MPKKLSPPPIPAAGADYDAILEGIADLLDHTRRSAARAVNSVLTSTYWEVGRRILNIEQGGK
jgi:hypothetical protein